MYSRTKIIRAILEKLDLADVRVLLERFHYICGGWGLRRASLGSASMDGAIAALLK
jgi:hypothetical protein